MMKQKVSLAIITLNEEANIARCIKSVPWADEVIVLDSGSTDNTLKIAKSLGAKCSEQAWLGYTAQKNKAAELCRNEWVLSLDADEALTEESSKEIQEFINSNDSEKYHGVSFPRKSYHLGRWIMHGGWYPDYQLRLFHRKHCYWQGGALHESVHCTSKMVAKKPILHWVFKDLNHQIETNNRYSSLGAQKLFDEKKSFSLFKLLFKPLSKFIETYIMKRGFLDGMAGFVISVGAAYSVFLKFSKLYYLEKDQKTKRQ